MQGSNQHISSKLPHDNHTCYDESEVFVVIKKTRKKKKKKNRIGRTHR